MTKKKLPRKSLSEYRLRKLAEKFIDDELLKGESIYDLWSFLSYVSDHKNDTL